MGRHSANNSRRDSLERGTRRGGDTPTRRRARAVSGAAPSSDRARAYEGIRDLSYDSADARRSGSLERAPQRLQAELNRRKHRGRRIATRVGIGLAAVLILAGVSGFIWWRSVESGLQRNITKKTKIDSSWLTKPVASKPYNILIMGFDKRPGNKHYRTDTMLLAKVDAKQKKIWMISLPRDYKVNIPGYGYRKLNAAYSFGEEKLAIKTIETLTGEKVNHYIGVNFTGFRKIVDAMGGVTVNVPYKINDPKADPSKGDKYCKIDKGTQVLDGNHALVFVRTRAFPNADITRMKDQQIFFKAVADKAANHMSITQLPGLVTTIVPYVSTDMSLMDLMTTARDMKDAGSDNMYTTTLPGTWISPFLVPDEAKKAEILTKFKNEEPFDAAQAKKTATLKPAAVKVTVRNGTTKTGVAKQAASILKTRGFDVGAVGNTDQQNVYTNTMVIYKSSKAAANLVAKYLQPGVKIVESRGMYSFKTDVLVVIGKDWDIDKVPVANITTK